jgi:serine phosphatase RsbU (regulator of sigma subunit)
MNETNTESRPRTYSLSTLLLLAVNVPLIVLVSLLLLSDYRREQRRATDERREMLTAEAALIGTALLELSGPEHPEAIKDYLARSCTLSANQVASDHWINASWNGETLHSHAGPGHDNHQEANDDQITGVFIADKLKVEVTEQASQIRRAARGMAITHLGGIVGLGALAALIVDIVLVQLITKPTQRLVETVEQLRANQFEMEPLFFRSEELNQLSVGIKSMADSLHQAAANHKLAMRRATQVQLHLLPQKICIPRLAFATHFQPAEEVAGDIFGVLELPDHSWLIYIADLVGHGIPAALSATVLKMLVESAAESASDPGEIMHSVNQRLPQYLAEGEFATATILRWHPESTELVIASAGHEPVLLVTQGRLIRIDADGIPLGIDPTFTWSTETFALKVGDRFLLATDGVPETFDADNQEFGRRRLAEMFQSSQAEDIEQFSKRLVRELRQHRGKAPLDDDFTFLIATCYGTANFTSESAQEPR